MQAEIRRQEEEAKKLRLQVGRVYHYIKNVDYKVKVEDFFSRI